MKTQLYITKILFLGVLLFTGCKKKEKDPEPTPPQALANINTSAISSITSYSAICGGNVTYAGTSAITSVGICWDTNPFPTTLRPHTNDGAGTGVYQSTLTGLQSNTTYYVRAYVTNGAGTSYGDQVTFKTTPAWTKTHPDNISYVFDALFVSGTNLLGGGSVNNPGVYLSTNDGASFTGPLPNSNIIVTSFLRKDNQVFAYGLGGIVVSSNNGASWLSAGLTNSLVFSMCTKDNNLYAGTGDNGIFISTNNGSTWTASNNGITDLNIQKLAVLGSYIFAGTKNDGVFRSSDNGATWITVNNGLSSLDIYALRSFGNNLILATNFGGAYISSDNGNNWSLITTLSNGTFDFVVSGNTIYAANSSGVLRSENNGATWTQINEGLASPLLTCICLSPSQLYINSNNTVYKRPL